jgi:5'-nucleotidase
VKEVRESAKSILLVDAGDLLFKHLATPVSEKEAKKESEKAQLIIETYNQMGYDAVGLGDDDFSLGKEFLLEAARKATFPIVCSNVTDEASGKLLFQPAVVKEVNGTRIGIFGLLAPDAFSGPTDPRKKGLAFKDPLETAREMVKELESKSDIVVCLSHLGYQKDMDLAKMAPGISVIVGSHTGINLSHPPVVQNTVILQGPNKGMYGAQLDLVIRHKGATFYNIQTKRSMENSLANVKARLTSSKDASEAEKAQWRRTRDEYEKTLAQFQSKNEFTNTFVGLNDQMREEPDLAAKAEAFRQKYPDPVKPPAGKPN